MTVKTDFFCVAVSGPTVDGREIKRQWLTDIAALYNPELYAARVNVEHFTAMFPGTALSAKGDVLAVQLKNEDINGKSEKALYAQLKPNSSLMDMVERGEKIYPSIEVIENFANTGKAYLVGLALTDRPASLGTQPLKFSTEQGSQLFSQSLPTTIHLENQNMPQEQNTTVTPPSSVPTATTAPEVEINISSTATPATVAAAMAAQTAPEGSTQPSAFSAAIEGIKNKLKIFSADKTQKTQDFSQLVDLMDTMTDTFTQAQQALEQKFNTLHSEHTALKQQNEGLLQQFKQLDTEPVQSTRPAATGADINAQQETDF